MATTLYERHMAMVERLVEVYRAQRCVCGRAKQRRKVLCPRCLTAVPFGVKAGLNSPERLTSAQTYRDCVVWLEESGYLGLGAADSMFPEEKGATA